MTTTKAQQKAVNKYVKNNYDRINITLPKNDTSGNKKYFKGVAENLGLSFNQYAIECMKYCADNKQFIKHINKKSGQ